MPLKDVVVLDESYAATNFTRLRGRCPRTRRLIEPAGCRLVYLPPYSPDYSPIENIWSKVKQLLRAAAKRTVDAVGQAIQWALQQVTATDCLNCFEACGYTLYLK